MFRELRLSYEEKKYEINKRLNDFSQIKGSDIFYELCFCLLTPQSNARKCDQAVRLLKQKDFLNKKINPEAILRNKTRFYKNKARYLLESKIGFPAILKMLNEIKDNKAVREWLIKNVKGLGYKESSHFLRNIGYRNLAILDRHILKNLKKVGVIDEIPKNLTKNKYLEIEKKFYKFSKRIGISMDKLDLLFWSLETGDVFKWE